MSMYIPVPPTVTPAWLTAVLRQGGALRSGEVLAVASESSGAFNSFTQRLTLRYSADAPPDLPARLIVKRNIAELWAIEAGAEEVKFYQLVAQLQPPPPAIVPCYAAAYDPASGNSYLLLEDLSATHAPPITRDQQIAIVEGVPPAAMLEQVVDTLAHHHAYWWDHSLLETETFTVGYWSRNAARFAQYLQRRTASWEDLLANEADWFPTPYRALYEAVLPRLQQHWQTYLYPRFQTQHNLTLLHGDAYFANFLAPKAGQAGPTYLIDWQSPGVDIGGYDLANLCATFWTPEQRHAEDREKQILARYHALLQTYGVANYSWQALITDYQAGLIYWLLVPLQDRYDGSSKDYWWPKMQCLVAAFHDWDCAALLGL
jgi:thiamine kinase-like enzyme